MQPGRSAVRPRSGGLRWGMARLQLAAKALSALLLCALPFTGCGYHAVGAATHLPPAVRTVSVPLFATHTEAYHTEVAMTQAVIRELNTRTRLRVTPSEGGEPDAILRGTILKEAVTPLTFNAASEQSSSFLLTVVLSVTLTDRNGKLLYENKNYVFRQQFESTTDLPHFFEEHPAATERLSRDLARHLVADLIESF